MSQQQLVPVNLYSAASDPTTPTISQGDIYYNTSTGVRIYNGSAWVAVGSSAGVTSITAGTGLTGGTITSTGTIAIDTSVTVDVSTAQSLSNKTISGSTNTLSNLNASNLTTGTVGTARLGTGTADNTTYLRGDGTWATVSVSVPQATATALGTVYGRMYTANPYTTGVGYNALLNATGINNCAIGYNAGRNLTTGTENTIIGCSAQTNSNIGSYGVYIGTYAGNGYLGSAVNYNTAVGWAALQSCTSGSQNTAIGAGAAYNNGLGGITSGTNNTVIGYNAIPSSGSSTNQITLGNSSISSLRCQVTSITALSDIRDKKDIQPLSFGLNFINKLKPVKFTWNHRQPKKPTLDVDGNPEIIGKVDIPDFGFIAQDIIALEDEYDAHDWLQLSLRDNPDKYEATPGRLIPILVNAIKELTARIEQLENK